MYDDWSDQLCFSKHAVLGLTKALSNEWSSKGINVNAISPGKLLPPYFELGLTPCLLRLHQHRHERGFDCQSCPLKADHGAHSYVYIVLLMTSSSIYPAAGRWGAPKDFEGAVIYLASAASDYVCVSLFTLL